MGHWQRDVLHIGIDGRRYVADRYVPDRKERDQSTTLVRKRSLAPDEVWPPPKTQAQPMEEPPRSSDPDKLMKLEGLSQSERRILGDSIQAFVRGGGLGNEPAPAPTPQVPATRKILDKPRIVKGPDGRLYRADYEDEL